MPPGEQFPLKKLGRAYCFTRNALREGSGTKISSKKLPFVGLSFLEKTGLGNGKGKINLKKT